MHRIAPFLPMFVDPIPSRMLWHGKLESTDTRDTCDERDTIEHGELNSIRCNLITACNLSSYSEVFASKPNRRCKCQQDENQ
jgi:hypothetical protein